jgi:hypothetical protein
MHPGAPAIAAPGCHREQHRFDPLQRGRLSVQRRNLAGDVVFDVSPQRLKIESPLVAEGIVEALPADPHLVEQRVGRGAFKPVVAKYRDGAVQRGVAFEFFRPGHNDEG